MNYWIGDKINSSYVSVWVSVPKLLADENTSIFMYYNNDNVETTSDENNFLKPTYVIGSEQSL
ncbi:MAG: DUF2341 domain-containing protein [Candidatus Peregrinibacteria bacterium]|nr:DUF2341 domain-containing protein [Candidatus Peregrinibacteria bacterium]